MARKTWGVVQIVSDGVRLSAVPASDIVGASRFRTRNAARGVASELREKASREGRPNCYTAREIVCCPECSAEHYIRANMHPADSVSCDCGKVWYPAAN